MKAIFILFIFICIDLSAQDPEETTINNANMPNSSIGKVQVGLNISPLRYFKTALLFYEENETDGPPEFLVKAYASLGITGNYRIGEHLSIGLGATYGKMLIKRQYGNYQPDNQKMSLLEIPLILRFEFLKYFYACQGLLYHLELIESGFTSDLSKFGYLMSLGFNYNLNPRLAVYIGPVLKCYPVTPHKDWESFIIIGVEFNFGVSIRL